MAIRQRTPDLAQSEGLRTVRTHTRARPRSDPHDEAGAVVFGGLGRPDYLSSFVRPLLLGTQKKISVSLNDQKVRFK